MREITIAAALFATLSLAVPGVGAGHQPSSQPAYRLGPVADDLDLATDDLYRMVARHADPRDYRDRIALRDVQGLMLRARGLRLALDDPWGIDGRRLMFLVDGLVREYDRVDRSVRYFRLPIALSRYAEAGELISELDAALEGAPAAAVRRGRLPFGGPGVRDSIDDREFGDAVRVHDRWDESREIPFDDGFDSRPGFR